MDDRGTNPPGLGRDTREASRRPSASRRPGTAAGGRLRVAFCPRFAVSCTDRLLREAGERAKAGGPRPHARFGEPRRDRPRRAADGPAERPLPRRRGHLRRARRPRPRHPHRRRGAHAPRGARHDRRALPVVEPEARLRLLPRPRVPRAGHPRHARRRRCSLQRPARRLHGDAARGPAAQGAARARGASRLGRRADGDGRGRRGARPERRDARSGPPGRLHAPRPALGLRRARLVARGSLRAYRVQHGPVPRRRHVRRRRGPVRPREAFP